MTFKPGDIVAIQCEVRPGPFSDELLVSIDTVNGPISGFVHASELRTEEPQAYVRGRVKQTLGDIIEVWIRGEFSTTAGLASVPSHRAIAA
jgi:hypothetical protein